MAEENSPPMKIYKQIPLCIGSIKAVGRNHTNDAQGFKFRSINDVFDAVNKVFAEHSVTIEPRYEIIRDEIGKNKNNNPQRMCLLKGTFKLFADDGSYIQVETYGEGIDAGDKAFYKAQTGALKYCLFQTLQIPVADPNDPDFTTTEIGNNAVNNAVVLEEKPLPF